MIPSDLRVQLWDAINRYAESGPGVYGNTRKQEAVVDVEATVEEIVERANRPDTKASRPDTCLTAISQLLSDEWEAEQLPEWKQIPGAVRALIEERDDWRHAVAELSAEVKSLDKGGAGMIAAERRRQVEVEGWTPEHDDEHGDRQMAAAAVAYIRYGNVPGFSKFPPACWPWHLQWWKPASYVRSLVKAGALLSAEIDRHLRAYPE